MADQTKKGKAFEYACLNALKNSLEINQVVVVEETSALKTAFEFYKSSDVNTIFKMDKAANAAIKIIFRLEPQFQNADKNIPLYLSIQEDKQGVAGDVRDILCIRKQNEWEIGLSCKHNHSAVKHSRLSKTIDFGMQWFGKACSEQYFGEVDGLFSELNILKENGKRWSEIKNKENRFYVPLLNMFISEIKRLENKYGEIIPNNLLQYLLGKNDFYKVITNDSKKITQVHAYNIYGTLNRNSNSIKSEFKVHQLKLPTKFYDISFKEKSNNTIIITCDNGWALSFRIHNASSFIETSLKFDVQLIGIPQSLHIQVEPWM